MQNQSLFSVKNNKKYFKMSSADIGAFVLILDFVCMFVGMLYVIFTENKVCLNQTGTHIAS